LLAYSGEWPTTSHDYNQSVPTNWFYGSQPSSTQTDYWQTIPTTNGDFHAFLYEMQFCIKREFDRAFEDLSDHLVDIENTVAAAHAVTIESLSSEIPSSFPSSEEVGSGKRKHLVPTELQVSYSIYDVE